MLELEVPRTRGIPTPPLTHDEQRRLDGRPTGSRVECWGCQKEWLVTSDQADQDDGETWLNMCRTCGVAFCPHLDLQWQPNRYHPMDDLNQDPYRMAILKRIMPGITRGFLAQQWTRFSVRIYGNNQDPRTLHTAQLVNFVEESYGSCPPKYHFQSHGDVLEFPKYTTG